jgi:hypothetical protein
VEGRNCGSSLFAVVTYQLPVPCGDCSVHLLLKGKDVVEGFIMDGGRDADGFNAADVIKKGVSAIAQIHFPKDLQKKFLHSWVVTHWDKDHYEGALGALPDLQNFEWEGAILYSATPVLSKLENQIVCLLLLA